MPQLARDANYMAGQQKGGMIGLGFLGAAAAAAVAAEAGAAAYAKGIAATAISYLLTPQGQQSVVNITQAVGDYVTGTVSPISAAEVGAAREAAVAASVGGKVSGMIVRGASTSTDVDVLGKAGEYISVGGPAKGFDLASFGQKLSALKDAAQQAGTTAKYYLEQGTSKETVDLAKKILGANNVVIFNISQKEQSIIFCDASWLGPSLRISPCSDTFRGAGGLSCARWHLSSRARHRQGDKTLADRRANFVIKTGHY